MVALRLELKSSYLAIKAFVITLSMAWIVLRGFSTCEFPDISNCIVVEFQSFLNLESKKPGCLKNPQCCLDIVFVKLMLLSVGHYMYECSNLRPLCDIFISTVREVIIYHLWN